LYKIKKESDVEESNTADLPHSQVCTLWFCLFMEKLFDNICASWHRSLTFFLQLLLRRHMEQASPDYHCSEEGPPDGG
jgi:hypothetical protein